MDEFEYRRRKKGRFLGIVEIIRDLVAFEHERKVVVHDRRHRRRRRLATLSQSGLERGQFRCMRDEFARFIECRTGVLHRT
jgi:hypothetical protein